MIRWLADEDFDNDIVRGFLRVAPDTDIVRVQDACLEGQPDVVVLEWAAENARVVLTYDARTMVAAAYARIAASLAMAGLFVVRRRTPLRLVIEHLGVLTVCSTDRERAGQVLFLPLR